MKLADMFKSNSSLSPQPGLYHYRFDSENEKSRAHLRLDADGHGTLIVNANQIMHLKSNRDIDGMDDFGRQTR